jgi:aqualysin 1
VGDYLAVCRVRSARRVSVSGTSSTARSSKRGTTLTGADRPVSIIDTGIRYDHVDFGGRAIFGADTVTSGGSGADCNGHGTHVAGTTGGATYGVAKAVTLVSVRVLGCNGSGSWSGVIAGIDWVTGDHQAAHPAVANMSLGGGGNCAVDTAGWFAPGVSITSDWSTGATASNTISGTSMATPHTTGVAALYLERNPNASPADVAAALDAKTTKGIVSSSKTAKSNLLFTDY